MTIDKATKICYYTTLVGIIRSVINMNTKVNKSKRLHELVIKQKELRDKQIKDISYYYLNKELSRSYYYDK